ncbi:PorV/PorQ family protein [candidate division GN15 bacterium]|nr:PorV/PorQ family protein [candidate division GN15 bacterium]
MLIRKSLNRIILGWILMVVLVALLGDVTIAASDNGRSSADFLHIGQGARAAAMGGAYTAVSEGAIASYWNAAGLTGLEGPEVSLGHFAWYQDISVEQAAFALPLKSRGLVAAASITYVNYGTVEGYDATGAYTGDLTVYDWVGGLSLGYMVNDQLSVGVTGKFVNQKLDDFSASTFAADLGLKYYFRDFTLAAAVTNFGGNMTFDETAESLPTAARIGIAARPFGNSMVASLEVEQRFEGDLILRQGIEMGFSNRYYLRTGYDYLPSQDGRNLSTALSFGAGIRLDMASFDYAYTPNDKTTSEDLHRFTLVFSLGR